VYDEGKSLRHIQPEEVSQAILRGIQEDVTKSARLHGVGFKSNEEVMAEAAEDLSHFSVALGRHKFFLGETPGVVDACAFSILTQIVWNMPNSPLEAAIKQHKPLMDYVFRMREEFWPDWKELVLKSSPSSSEVSQMNSIVESDTKSKAGDASENYADKNANTSSGISGDHNTVKTNSTAPGSQQSVHIHGPQAQNAYFSSGYSTPESVTPAKLTSGPFQTPARSIHPQHSGVQYYQNQGNRKFHVLMQLSFSNTNMTYFIRFQSEMSP
jgi:hypothetical protein